MSHCFPVRHKKIISLTATEKTVTNENFGHVHTWMVRGLGWRRRGMSHLGWVWFSFTKTRTGRVVLLRLLLAVSGRTRNFGLLYRNMFRWREEQYKSRQVMSYIVTPPRRTRVCVSSDTEGVDFCISSSNSISRKLEPSRSDDGFPWQLVMVAGAVSWLWAFAVVSQECFNTYTHTHFLWARWCAAEVFIFF